MFIDIANQKSFLAFVFRGSKFSFVARVEYLLFHGLLLGGLFMVSYFFWNLLFSKLMMYGVLLLPLFISWGLRIDKKFTEPYLEYRGMDKQAGIKRAQLVIEFNNAMGRFSGQKTTNQLIIAVALILISAGAYFGIVIIPKMGWSGSMFRLAVVLMILLMGLLYVKVRGMWRSIETNRIDELRGLRRVQLMTCCVCFIASILFCGILGYRYKEITGHAIFSGGVEDIENIEQSDFIDRSGF